MSKNAGKASVRCSALDMAGLAAMEAHGKRLDASSQRRKIRDDSPLVFGSLDLRPAYNAHMNGVKLNAGAKKPVLHFILRFPPELLAGDKIGHFDGDKEARQKMMLRQAVQFVNETHGGHAVFAARVDRDELGETIVDVFAVPRYEKRTKRTPDDEFGEMWGSATKYGKELAMRHAEEIHRRHPKAKSNNLTSPRMVGIALQSEFANWFEEINGIPLAPKQEKGTSAPDRLEKEAHERIERRSDIQRRWDERRAHRLAAEFKAEVTADLMIAATELEHERDELHAIRQDLERREAIVAKKEGILGRAFGVISQFVERVGSALGITMPEEIVEALDEIERLNASSFEDAIPEVDGPGF